MLNKTSSYEIKLSKAIVGGVRNFDCYYIVIRQEGNPTKYISKAMRNDQDNEDFIKGEIEIKPTCIQLWNYDKMKIVEACPVDFKHQPNFTWQLTILQVPPQTKFNNKSNKPETNAQPVDTQKSKAGSHKNIEVSNISREKSRVQEVNATKELLSSNALPPLPKREE